MLFDSSETQVEIDSEQHFRLLAETVPTMVWVTGPDGFAEYFNERWYRFTGLPHGSTNGWDWQNVVHPDDLDESVRRWKESLATGNPYEVEYRLRRADGEYRWFIGRGSPLRDRKNQIYKWFGICSDIHDRKVETFKLGNEVQTKTAELRVSEHRMATVADVLSAFVATRNIREACSQLILLALKETGSEYGFVGATVPGGPHGVTLRVFADEGFNWSQTENRELYEKVIGDYETKGYIDFPQLDNLFGWPILNGDALITNEPENDQRRSGRRPLGHPPLRNFLGLPIFRGDEVVGAMGIANREGGYSEQQRASLRQLLRACSGIFESYRRSLHEQEILEERDAAEKKLKQTNETLMDLAYTVSHELQEPLRIVKTQLGLLSARYRGKLGADADEFISDTKTASNTVERMVDDLWEYARIDRPHIRFHSLEMEELFGKVVAGLEDVIKSRSAVIEHVALPAVHGDNRELTTLVRQLLSNALQFNTSAVPQVEVSATQTDDFWQFCFSDNGIGFEQVEMHDMFRMFRKLRRESPGTGMGLAIAKRIVEFHGGRIWAESEPGKGAQFYFTLPLVPVR